MNNSNVYNKNNSSFKAMSRSLKNHFGADFHSLFKTNINIFEKSFGKNNVFFSYDNNKVIIAGIKKQHLSYNNSISTVFIMSSSNNNHACSKDTTRGKNYDLLCEEFVSFLMCEVFLCRGYDKLIIEIPDCMGDFKNSLDNNRFSVEGMSAERFLIEGSYYNGTTYSLFKKAFDNYSSGVIYSGGHYIKVTGTNNKVTSIINCSEEEADSIITRNKTVVGLYKDYNYSAVKKCLIQLNEYFEGKRRKFDINVSPLKYTPFQESVWEACSNVNYGQTKSYEQIAFELYKSDKNVDDSKKFARAVGTALAKNPLLIVIPCHRVIGKDGRLRGFSAGLDFKDYLLNLEMENILNV